MHALMFLLALASLALVLGGGWLFWMRLQAFRPSNMANFDKRFSPPQQDLNDR